MHITPQIAAGICLMLLGLPVRLTATPAAAAASPFRQATWEDLRWEQVVRQTTTHNCGAAALATALTMLSGTVVHPTDLHPEDVPVSLARLAAILQARGYTGVGLRMTTESLAAYLRYEGLPVIAHLLVPTPHFTLVTAHVGQRFIVHDPSMGLTAWEEADWAQVWSGAALLIRLPTATADRAPGGLEHYPPAQLLVDRISLLSTPKLNPVGR